MRLRVSLVIIQFALLLCSHAFAQTRPTGQAGPSKSSIAPELTGRRVEQVQIVGNRQVPAAIIRNVIRTTEGEPLDPATVVEDYQRIYGLRKFSNVEAKVEPTEAGGVIVVFQVTEQTQIVSITYRGNKHVDTKVLEDMVDLRENEAVDRFRLTLARRSIEQTYRDRNYPFAHVEIDQAALQDGEVIFNITEGPNVRVRKVNFIGNHSFTGDTLRKQCRTQYWIWIFRPGTFEMETVEDDVASLRRFYEQKGFFDVRVGRKLIFSPDQTEMQIDFVIEEGPRYIIDRISFKGNSNLSESELRKELKLQVGSYYDGELLQRDVRQIVKDYSPLGYIYQPQSKDRDYLQIDTRTVFRPEAGTMELVYEIREGKPFRLGRILVKGNTKTQDKVILREMRVSPGQLYNSGEVQEATDRLKNTPFFSSVTVTPIGNDPEVRDVLVEVVEQRTASFNIGAGINSNGGIGANITYEQRNFDITDWPQDWREAVTGDALIGAGQQLRISLEPGTEFSNASIRFTEPWLFDQPYSFTGEAYWRERERDHYDETHAGGRISFGKRFGYHWSALLTLRGENVLIDHIEDPPERAQDILAVAGNSTITSTGITIRRDTTDRGFFPSEGSTTSFTYEVFGTFGGYSFNEVNLSWDRYLTLYEDLVERKTILGFHLDSGYIFCDGAPFFGRFYAGGIGSVRGFQFRGISPRQGPDDDAIGGDFVLTGSIELGFPIIGDNLRGVVFTDAGTVEPNFEIDNIRTSVGFGIRLVLPIFGQAPISVDFAFPITKEDEDETQLISFSFGVAPFR